MPQKQINIIVATKGAIQAYWVAIGYHDITLTNGQGTAMLETGQKHILTWWMNGDPGSSLAIELKDAIGSTVLNIKELKIPAGEVQGAGTRRFEIKA